MSIEPLLVVRNLTKHFPVRKRGRGFSSKAVVKALDGVDLSVGKGETLALVGESGCGKTTTARLILRLEHPTDGEVLLDGERIHGLGRAGLRNFRTKVQAVFQDPWASLNPRMRVRDIVSEALVVNRKISTEDVHSRLEEVMDQVGLSPEHLNNYPHEFSGGQRQRVAIAGAIVSQPELLILDEPVSALDVSIRSQIMNLLRDIQKRMGVTYVLVAHDLGTTRYMADQTAVMYLGRIVEIGPTEEVFENTSHPYTKALFSAALPSHPDTSTKETILQGEVPSPLNPPGGCPFHTRCPVKIGRRCEVEAPRLRQIPGAPTPHLGACHLLD